MRSAVTAFLILAAAALGVPSPAQVEPAGEPAARGQLLAGAAVGQIRDEAPESYGFLEYRLAFKVPRLGSWVAVEFAGPTRYYGAGLTYDLFSRRRLAVVLSFGPGVVYGDGARKLGHEMQFRSSLELWYRLEGGFRLGAGLCHYSNGGLGKINPGEESVRIMFSVPLRWGRR